MKQFLNRYWFLILLAFGATFLVLVKKFFQINPFPVVVSLNPSSGEIEGSLEVVEINFQELVNFSPKDFSLVALPSLQFNLEIKENKLLATPRDKFLFEEKYIFELRYKNQPLYSWSYFFVPPPVSELEKEQGYGQGSPKAVEEIKKQTKEEYPLIKYMPRETDNYYLNYTKPLTLGIRAKKGTKEEVRREAQLWLEEIGIGADSHEFVWLE